MLKGNSSFAGNLDIQLAQPADGRQICQYKKMLYINNNARFFSKKRQVHQYTLA